MTCIFYLNCYHILKFVTTMPLLHVECCNRKQHLKQQRATRSMFIFENRFTGGHCGYFVGKKKTSKNNSSTISQWLLPVRNQSSVLALLLRPLSPSVLTCLLASSVQLHRFIGDIFFSLLTVKKKINSICLFPSAFKLLLNLHRRSSLRRKLFQKDPLDSWPNYSIQVS